MSRHVTRPRRYSLTQAEFIVMGTALSLAIGLLSFGLAIVLFGGWR